MRRCDHCDIPTTFSYSEAYAFWCAECWHSEAGQALLKVADVYKGEPDMFCTYKKCTAHNTWTGENATRAKSIPKVYRCPQCEKVHP